MPVTGRPRLPEEKRRTIRVCFLVSQEEINSFNIPEGMSPSKFFRERHHAEQERLKAKSTSVKRSAGRG